MSSGMSRSFTGKKSSSTLDYFTFSPLLYHTLFCLQYPSSRFHLGSSETSPPPLLIQQKSGYFLRRLKLNLFDFLIVDVGQEARGDWGGLAWVLMMWS